MTETLWSFFSFGWTLVPLLVILVLVLYGKLAGNTQTSHPPPRFGRSQRRRIELRPPPSPVTASPTSSHASMDFTSPLQHRGEASRQGRTRTGHSAGYSTAFHPQRTMDTSRRSMHGREGASAFMGGRDMTASLYMASPAPVGSYHEQKGSYAPTPHPTKTRVAHVVGDSDGHVSGIAGRPSVSQLNAATASEASRAQENQPMAQTPATKPRVSSRKRLILDGESQQELVAQDNTTSRDLLLKQSEEGKTPAKKRVRRRAGDENQEKLTEDDIIAEYEFWKKQRDEIQRKKLEKKEKKSRYGVPASDDEDMDEQGSELEVRQVRSVPPKSRKGRRTLTTGKKETASRVEIPISKEVLAEIILRLHEAEKTTPTFKSTLKKGISTAGKRSVAEREEQDDRDGIISPENKRKLRQIFMEELGREDDINEALKETERKIQRFNEAFHSEPLMKTAAKALQDTGASGSPLVGTGKKSLFGTALVTPDASRPPMAAPVLGSYSVASQLAKESEHSEKHVKFSESVKEFDGPSQGAQADVPPQIPEKETTPNVPESVSTTPAKPPVSTGFTFTAAPSTTPSGGFVFGKPASETPKQASSIPAFTLPKAGATPDVTNFGKPKEGTAATTSFAFANLSSAEKAQEKEKASAVVPEKPKEPAATISTAGFTPFTAGTNLGFGTSSTISFGAKPSTVETTSAGQVDKEKTPEPTSTLPTPASGFMFSVPSFGTEKPSATKDAFGLAAGELAKPADAKGGEQPATTSSPFSGFASLTSKQAPAAGAGSSFVFGAKSEENKSDTSTTQTKPAMTAGIFSSAGTAFGVAKATDTLFSTTVPSSQTSSFSFQAPKGASLSTSDKDSSVKETPSAPIFGSLTSGTGNAAKLGTETSTFKFGDSKTAPNQPGTTFGANGGTGTSASTAFGQVGSSSLSSQPTAPVSAPFSIGTSTGFKFDAKPSTTTSTGTGFSLSSTSADNAASKPVTGFTFGSNATAPGSTTSTTFMFGASSNAATTNTTAPATFSFGATNTASSGSAANAPGFTFGGNPSAADTSKQGLIFGQSNTAGNTGATAQLFGSQPSGNTFGFGSNTAKTTMGDDSMMDDGPKKSNATPFPLLTPNSSAENQFGAGIKPTTTFGQFGGTSNTSGFQFQAPTSTFGNTQSMPAQLGQSQSFTFGANAQTNPFGQTSAGFQPQSPAFGGQGSFQGTFGSGQQTFGSPQLNFANNQPAFNSHPPTQGGFGSPSVSSPNIFGGGSRPGSGAVSSPGAANRMLKVPKRPSQKFLKK